MGFWGGRHLGEGKEIHKWQYINLADFKTSSCPTVFSYIWLWGLTLTSVAVYAVDTFTAVNLLAFNRWTSEVKPVIDFNITKWIFVGCILFSWALCFYEWVRAIRVIKQESVTEDFLDPLAVVWQSIRIPGGWRRFLVFAELTKSNKKATWVAVYVYFERKGALRVLAAEGPRNVLNAFTIYSVARADLINIGGSKSDSFIGQFFENVKTLFNTKRQEGIVLFSMTFTFIIWFFSMLMLLLALLLWIFYISHHVDKETLTGYCRRKVETKLSKIIKDKTDKIWAKEEAEREKLAIKNGLTMDKDKLEAIKRQPTLPVFATSPPKSNASFLSRNESVATLPQYQSTPGTPGEDDLPPMPTQYLGKESLLGNTAPMGQSYPISRPETAASNQTFGSQRGPFLPPLSTNDSYQSYNSYNSYNGPPPSDYNRQPRNDFNGPPRGESASSSFESNRRYSPPSAANNTPWRGNNSFQDDEHQEYEMQQPTLPGAMRPGNGRNTSTPMSDRNQMPYPPQRNMAAPSGYMNDSPRGGSAQPTLPRSMTPGFGANLPPSMMAGNPRSMTPGAPPNRSHTPGASSVSSQNSGYRYHPQNSGAQSMRSQTQTPGAQSVRSQMSGPPPSLRSQTPGARGNPSGNNGNARPGGGPPAPGMAF